MFFPCLKPPPNPPNSEHKPQECCFLHCWHLFINAPNLPNSPTLSSGTLGKPTTLPTYPENPITNPDQPWHHGKTLFFGWWAVAAVDWSSELGNCHIFIHEGGHYRCLASKRELKAISMHLPHLPSAPSTKRELEVIFSIFQCLCHCHLLPRIQVWVGGGFFRHFDPSATPTTFLASKRESEVDFFQHFNDSVTIATSLTSKCELEVDFCHLVPALSSSFPIVVQAAGGMAVTAYP